MDNKNNKEGGEEEKIEISRTPNATFINVPLPSIRVLEGEREAEQQQQPGQEGEARHNNNNTKKEIYEKRD